MSHMCCTGSYDKAQQLVQVCRKRKSKEKNMTIEEKNNLSEEHKRFAKEIMSSSSIGNGEFLINVMWLDETTKRYHWLYLEILGIDVGFRTNAERCSLHCRCSKAIDSLNLLNIFSCAPLNQVSICNYHVIFVHFLKSIASWVNNWCAEKDIPALLDKDTLKKLN